MRWLTSLASRSTSTPSGLKRSVSATQSTPTGGGWFDWIDTSPQTYIEQARVTILGGAHESFLFVFGGLQSSGGKDDVEALVQNQKELVQVAAQVATREITGVAAYKPPNSHGGCVSDPKYSAQCGSEMYVYDFVGMLGIPLIPTWEFPPPTKFPSAFFSVHSLKDPQIVAEISAYIESGNPTLVTDGLVSALSSKVDFSASNVYILNVTGNPPLLLSSPPTELQIFRDALLTPLGLQFTAPVNVSYFPFSDGSWVVENFSNKQVEVQVAGNTLSVGARAWQYSWKSNIIN